MAATNASQTADVQSDDRATPDDLIMLDGGEAIRCANHEYSIGVDEGGDRRPDAEVYDPYEWYYALEQGEVTIYHRLNYFRPNAAITEAQARQAIQSAPESDVVDHGELVAAQRRVSEE